MSLILPSSSEAGCLLCKPEDEQKPDPSALLQRRHFVVEREGDSPAVISPGRARGESEVREPTEHSNKANERFAEIISQHQSDLSNKDLRELSALLKNPDQVTVFRLYSNHLYDDDDLLKITELFKNLHELDLSLHSIALPDELRDLAPPFEGADASFVNKLMCSLDDRVSKVQTLSLRYVSEAEPKDLLKLIQKIPDLTHLTITDCSKLTSEDVKTIAQHTGKLKTAHFAHNPLLNGEGLLQLFQANPELETVDISHCHGIEERHLRSMTKSLPACTNLNLEHLDQCSDEVTQLFLQRCPKLRSLLGLPERDGRLGC
jgi:hypothetical protein